ncbi:MAG: 5'-nucleotidase [Gammaproteobacteria bacterium]
MKNLLEDKLIVAISSRALFNLDESNAVFENEGVTAYAKYQIAHENDVLEPGVAFPLVHKLLALHNPQTEQALVEVILLSRNSSDTGLRIFNSIQHHQLNITRAVFTNGISPYKYIPCFGADLFLSANHDDVLSALHNNHAAATILAGKSTRQAEHDPELRIAFDGDAVLFSDASEKIFQEKGLAAFNANEIATAAEPLAAGPFKNFLMRLHAIQNMFSEQQCPIRTALVTARSAPAHERVIRTLRAWNIRIDQALFLGGLDKSKFLHAFGADIFFDDQVQHCTLASKLVATGHVPAGVKNILKENK